MTILVAVANDRLSEAVVETAVSLADGLGEELYVVHLVDGELADADAKQVRDRLRRRLAEAPVVTNVSLEHVGRLSPRTESRVGHELVEIAEDIEVRHIVMGHRSKGVLATLSTGNAAFAVADKASVPVTIVPRAS